MYIDRVRLFNIRNHINEIASYGKDNYMEFYKYINELIEDGDYLLFEEVLYLEYDIDIKGRSVDDYKKETWLEICTYTSLPLHQLLKIIYDEYNIYQNSTYIYHSEFDESNLIGSIIEDAIESDSFAYYKRNKNYARLIGEYRNILKVVKFNNSEIAISNIIKNNIYSINKFDDFFEMKSIKVFVDNDHYVDSDNYEITYDDKINISFKKDYDSVLITFYYSIGEDYIINSNGNEFIRQKEKMKIFEDKNEFINHIEALEYLLDIEIEFSDTDYFSDIRIKKDPNRDGGYFKSN